MSNPKRTLIVVLLAAHAARQITLAAPPAASFERMAQQSIHNALRYRAYSV
jgi:hypothetical protein